MRVVVETPLALTSFFQVVERNGEVGARGGGFILHTPLRTVVKEGRGKVIINGEEVRDSTSEKALSLFLEDNSPSMSVDVVHEVPVPIGAGFGTSGSGALGAVIGASILLSGPEDYYKLARYAHDAEIIMGTGLGTVSSISSMPTGAGLLVEPGPPGKAIFLPLIFNEESYRILYIVFSSKSTKKVLSSKKAVERLSKAGEKALNIVEKDPKLEVLLSAARRFAEECGIVEKYLLSLSDKLKEMGALGAAPNMIGNAVHALIEKDKTLGAFRKLRTLYPKAHIGIGKIGKGYVKIKVLK